MAPIIGAPRVHMSRIATAASSALRSSTHSTSHGSLRWSRMRPAPAVVGARDRAAVLAFEDHGTTSAKAMDVAALPLAVDQQRLHADGARGIGLGPDVR
ncbi:MAG: hypothetical protein WDN24_02005 [Sphingomonas sp.]